ncbi:MAG: ribosome small subunit-dependent GTPase A [Acidobacteria bacterium]|nr:ribosome small subunit-dependent GTPase A [Acidobacteriota bacterium]
MDFCRVVKLCGKKHWVYDGENTFPAFPAGRFELDSSNIKNRIAVGDYVKLKVQKGKDPLIAEILPRKNKLSRKMTFSNKEHIIASNIDEACIVVAPNPVLKRGLVDRFLCACNAEGIPLFVVINKADLLEKNEVDDFKDIYLKYGLKVFVTSVLDGSGFGKLNDYLKNKWVLLVGHSGVGKSSIANLLCPEAHLKVGEVSEENLKGKHITTSSTAVKLSQGGFLIDTAGIREFALYNVSQREIQSAFLNIEKISLGCKFSNCTHRNEVGCEVLEALSKGELDSEEYNSYLTLLKEANDITK